ncbi:MAG: DUF4349 domain-containing protein [Leptonema sp. (in: bacteria)]
MKFLIVVSIFLLLGNLHPKESLEHLKINIALKVNSPETVRKKLLEYTEKKNGYLKKFDNTSIQLIFPKTTQKEEIINYIKNLGAIVSQSIKTEDYSDELIKLQTKIKVKEKYLRELNQLTGEANLLQTLDMEKEIAKIIEELEELKGSYLYYLELVSSQEVQIFFTFLETSSLPLVSAPGWVSDLGIFNFYKSFRMDISKNAKKSKGDPNLPSFAKYNFNHTFLEKYITAEGILLGIREVKNEPKADSLEVWDNSIMFFIEKQGYMIKEKKTLGDFKYILSEGVSKEDTFVYGIAFKFNESNKDKILVIEFGGLEKNYKKNHKEIVDFIKKYKKK